MYQSSASILFLAIIDAFVTKALYADKCLICFEREKLLRAFTHICTVNDLENFNFNFIVGLYSRKHSIYIIYYAACLSNKFPYVATMHLENVSEESEELENSTSNHVYYGVTDSHQTSSQQLSAVVFQSCVIAMPSAS